jgi:hypothetical protein
MTIAASGAVSGQNIRDELRQSGGNIVLPDPTTRWLTEKPSGSVIWPTDFYSKMAVKPVHTVQVGGSGTTFTVPNINLGIDFPGRLIVVCISCIAAATASQILISSVVLGGVTLATGPGQAWFKPAINVSMGIAWNVVSGTSATLQVNFNQTAAVLHCEIYSMSNANTTFATNQSGALSGTSASTTLNIPANGVLFVAGLKSDDSSGVMNFSGANEIVADAAMGSSVRVGSAVINRLPSETSRLVGISCGGANGIVAIAAVSFG